MLSLRNIWKRTRTGILDTVRVRASGFIIRKRYEEFAPAYVHPCNLLPEGNALQGRLDDYAFAERVKAEPELAKEACRLLLRAVLEAAFPDAVSWQRAVQRGWQQRWAPLRAAWPRAKTRKLCQRERKLRKANERAVVALRRTGEEMAFAFGSLPMEVRDVEAFDLVDSTIGMLHSNSLLSVQQTHGFVPRPRTPANDWGGFYTYQIKCYTIK